jgi:DNA-binding CsgD family transcriptional regulator
MFDKISAHPAIIHRDRITTICKPLQRLNISYFSHVRINKKGDLSILSNKPDFMAHYLENKYYNADIHLAEKKLIGNHVVWDSLDRHGKTKQMEFEAAQLGVQHTFSIIEHSQQGEDYYHFSTHLSDPTINQIYLSNIDLLKYFIRHFNESVNSDKSLSHAHNIHFTPDYQHGKYSFKRNNLISLSEYERMEFINSLNINQETVEKNKLLQTLKNCCGEISSREAQVLLLMIKGKSARAIADDLNLSCRTVEHYIVNLKFKTGVESKMDLIGKFIDKLLIAS